MPEANLYRWTDLPADSPMPRIERRRIMGERMMLSHVHLQAGFVVPTHSHENEQFAVVLAGEVKFMVGEPAREVIARAGEVLHLPGGVPHSAEALKESMLLDLFSPVSEKTGVDGAKA